MMVNKIFNVNECIVLLNTEWHNGWIRIPMKPLISQNSSITINIRKQHVF